MDPALMWHKLDTDARVCSNSEVVGTKWAAVRLQLRTYSILVLHQGVGTSETLKNGRNRAAGLVTSDAGVRSPREGL